MADIAFAYLMRIAEEDTRARAAAPNYMEIAEVKKALGKAMGDDSISALQAVVEKYPWIATPIEQHGLPAPTVGRGGPDTSVPLRMAPPPPTGGRGGHALDTSVPTVSEATAGETPPVDPARLVKKTTGKMATDPETGERREVKTIINPQGDLEAARMTKETGELHIVDPLSGAIVNTSIGVPRLPDGGTLERDPMAIMPVGGGDIRPNVSMDGKGLKDRPSV
jgi:hypothetical protein